METDRGEWHIVKPDRDSSQGPASLPSNQLWGREVYDTKGRPLGTIDSIVRTYDGPVRAIVRTGKRPSQSVFVDLGAAVFQGDAVIVPFARRAGNDAEDRPTPRLKLVWPLALRRRG